MWPPHCSLPCPSRSSYAHLPESKATWKQSIIERETGAPNCSAERMLVVLPSALTNLLVYNLTPIQRLSPQLHSLLMLFSQSPILRPSLSPITQHILLVHRLPTPVTEASPLRPSSELCRTLLTTSPSGAPMSTPRLLQPCLLQNKHRVAPAVVIYLLVSLLYPTSLYVL